MYPSHQASSPAKYLLPALLSQKQQPPLLVIIRIKAAFTPGLLAGSEQQPPSCQTPRSCCHGHVHKIHQVSGRSTHIPIRQRPLTKCFRLFSSMLSKRIQCPGHSGHYSPCAAQDSQGNSVQRCSKAQSEHWVGSMQLVGHRFLVLSPVLNKPRIRCNVKRRKTQAPRCSNSWRKDTGMNSNPFFFDSVVQKKSEYLSLHSCPFRSYTQHSGEDHANSSTLYENIFSFFTEKAAHIRMEKVSILKF